MTSSALVPGRLVVGYGSESGTARALARRLGAALVQAGHPADVQCLDECGITALGHGDALIAVTSSFGDGEPPANAATVLQQLHAKPACSGVRHAVFGLGDTAYPRFCGFSRDLDQLLLERGSQPLLQRVDADQGHEAFFQRWLAGLLAVLGGNAPVGGDLGLQIIAYGQTRSFSAPLLDRRRLSTGGQPAWHLQLDLRGSGMHCQAGDTLYVLPRNDPGLLDALARWYGQPEAATLLQDRELRRPTKAVLRALARRCDAGALLELLKTSHRRALDAYLWDTDMLDILQDHADPQRLPLGELHALLPPCLPRAYSIASHADAQGVELCVREVAYVARSRPRRGTATGWLLHGPAQVDVYSRRNPAFRLPPDPAVPLLMVGTGTGIAPLRGLLQEMEAEGARETHLVFGEKHAATDYLYRHELERWCQRGDLASLRTAFSRDGQAKYYVQDALQAHAAEVAQLLQRGAHLYLCGSKAHLETAIETTLDAIVPGSWNALRQDGRLHCELY